MNVAKLLEIVALFTHFGRSGKAEVGRQKAEDGSGEKKTEDGIID